MNRYQLQTEQPGVLPALIEVYPHTAILHLMPDDGERPWRFAYKVSRSGRLWRGHSVEQRKAKLLEAFAKLRGWLGQSIAQIELDLPQVSAVTSLSSLKRYDDMLDGIVCAWTGLCYAAGAAEAFGDQDSAIWVPTVRESMTRTFRQARFCPTVNADEVAHDAQGDVTVDGMTFHRPP